MNSSKKNSTSSFTPNKRFKIYVKGLHCAGCISKIDRLILESPEIIAGEFNLSLKTLTVELTSPEKIEDTMKGVERLGFSPTLISDQKNKSDDDSQVESSKDKKVLIQKAGVALFCTGNIMLLSVSAYGGLDGELRNFFDWLSLFLFLPVFFYSSSEFYASSWKSLKASRPNIDMPIAISIIIGGGLGIFNLLRGQGDIYFDSLSALVTLLLWSRIYLRFIQEKFLHSSHLSGLLKTNDIEIFDPATNAWTKSSSEKIDRKDLYRLNDGHRVPTDGILESKIGFFDPSILTGESLPKRIAAGEKVFAGMRLIGDACEIRSLTNSEKSRIGQLLKKVEAQFKIKPNVTQLTDKAAHWFTIGILLSATLFFALYAMVDVNEAIRRSLALAVIACPCALALATPLVFSMSLLRAAKHGILIKSSDVFERLIPIKSLFFDKTGTITSGKFQFLGTRGEDLTDFDRAMIFHLEKSSSHPIARSLVNSLNLKGREFVELKKVEVNEILGLGVFTEFKGVKYSVRSIQPKNIEAVEKKEKMKKEKISEVFENLGVSTGYFIDDKLHTILKFGDSILEKTTESIKDLKLRGHEVFLLSGDRLENALVAGRQVGIDKKNIIGGTSPELKQKFVEQYSPCLMIGDGLNDLAAMSKSSVSVSVNSAMLECLQNTDVYFLNPGIEDVPVLFRIAEETYKLTKRNIIFSVFYNVIGGGLALAGFINPLLAAVLMPISSTLVVTSSYWGTSFLRHLEKATSKNKSFLSDFDAENNATEIKPEKPPQTVIESNSLDINMGVAK